MSLLNVVSYVFINVFYLVLFCIHVCVDVIKKTYFFCGSPNFGAHHRHRHCKNVTLPFEVLIFVFRGLF